MHHRQELLYPQGGQQDGARKVLLLREASSHQRFTNASRRIYVSDCGKSHLLLSRQEESTTSSPRLMPSSTFSWSLLPTYITPLKRVVPKDLQREVPNHLQAMIKDPRNTQLAHTCRFKIWLGLATSGFALADSMNYRIQEMCVARSHLL